jgi:hypothetical protein
MDPTGREITCNPLSLEGLTDPCPLVSEAFAYNVYYGTHPDKLYNSVIVLDKNELWFKALDSQFPLYFTIEAINENGISERFEILGVQQEIRDHSNTFPFGS